MQMHLFASQASTLSNVEVVHWRRGAVVLISCTISQEKLLSCNRWQCTWSMLHSFMDQLVHVQRQLRPRLKYQYTR